MLHVYYFSCWMPSKKGYEELNKIVHQFLWTNWDGNSGFKTSSWLHCIQLRNKGGLGLIDPKIQGICLSTKWIIRLMNGDEPWKILVCHRISLVVAYNKWQGVGWIAKILMAYFFCLRASFLYNPFGQYGIKFVIFWNGKILCKVGLTLLPLLFGGTNWCNIMGLLLKSFFPNKPCVSSGKGCNNLLISGIIIHLIELIGRILNYTSSWITNLEGFLYFLNPRCLLIWLWKYALLCNVIFIKIGFGLGKFFSPFFSLNKIYLTLLPNLKLNPRLNVKWRCKFKEKTWRNLSAQIWKSKSDSNAQFLAWKFLHHKLPVGDKLRNLNTVPTLCLFCRCAESVKHIFWDRFHAKKKWMAIFEHLPIVFDHVLGWKEAFLGFGLTKNIITKSMRQTILLHIWKSICLAIFF